MPGLWQGGELVVMVMREEQSGWNSLRYAADGECVCVCVCVCAGIGCSLSHSEVCVCLYVLIQDFGTFSC